MTEEWHRIFELWSRSLSLALSTKSGHVNLLQTGRGQEIDAQRVQKLIRPLLKSRWEVV